MDDLSHILADSPMDYPSQTTWREQGPFHVWKVPQGIGVVHYDQGMGYGSAMVLYTDGGLYTKASENTGELKEWVERLFREGNNSTWRIILEDDPNEATPKPDLVSSPVDRTLTSPVQRGQQLKTLRLDGNG